MGNSSSDIYFTIISVTAVLLIMLAFIVSFLFIYKNRQLKHRVEMESVQEKFNREILQTQLEIREQTLKYIAEELHDNVGQLLSLVVLNLSAVDLNDKTKTAGKLEQTTRLVQKAVADMRNLSKTFDGDNITNLGLVPLTAFELELLEKTGIYKTTFSITGEEQRLHCQKELVLYRVIQESLNNIIKHAGATAITIQFSYSATHLDIIIADNGRGFKTASEADRDLHSAGAGINNMKKRVALIGGIMDIQSMMQKGTAVKINTPLQESL